MRPHGRPRPLHQLPRRGRGVLGGRVVLDHGHRRVPRRAHRRDVRAIHRMGQRVERAEGLTPSDLTMSGVAAGGTVQSPRPSRRVNRMFRRRRSLGLFSVLSPPVAWMLLIYIGSLVLLVFAAFFALDPVSQKTTTDFTLDNVDDAISNTTALTLFAKTVGVAAAVTAISIALA